MALIRSISRPGTASAGRSKANLDSMALLSPRELGRSPSPTEARPSSRSWPTRTATGPSPPSSPPPTPSPPTPSRRSNSPREKRPLESSTTANTGPRTTSNHLSDPTHSGTTTTSDLIPTFRQVLNNFFLK
ncbi:UNVERIFIED_CONTAM: hypothetical protein GTU68_018261 [Idotea baltica]|nr:hypothetical protein [Idotea baltica]